MDRVNQTYDLLIALNYEHGTNNYSIKSKKNRWGAYLDKIIKQKRKNNNKFLNSSGFNEKS